jgi:hypothetical protein
VRFPPDEALIDVVRRHPGSTKWELILILGQEGWPGIESSQLNSHIYPLSQLEWRPGLGNERRWYFIGEELEPPEGEIRAPRIPTPSFDQGESHQELQLYPWQRDALRAWEEANRVGVIEPVTGAGKTRVAIAAIASHLDAVVAPSLDTEFERMPAG